MLMIPAKSGRRTGTIAALAAGLAILTLAPAPASAQFFFRSWGAPAYAPAPFYYGRPAGMRAGDVHRMLAEDGYDVIGVYRNGGVFVADVFGRRGRDRLIVDAASGRIVQAYGNGRGGRIEEPAYSQPRRTARVIPPADIESRVIPGYSEPSAPSAARPRAVAPQRVKPAKPREEASVPRSEPRATRVTPARPAIAAKPAPETKPLTPAPSAPPSEAVRAAPAPQAPAQTAPVQAAAPASRVNDIPVAPLDDATPRIVARPPVNDVPVAPLD